MALQAFSWLKPFTLVPCSAEGGARARARNRTSLYIPFDYEHEHRFTEHEHETERSRNEPYNPLKFLNNQNYFDSDTLKLLPCWSSALRRRAPPMRQVRLKRPSGLGPR
jgi:hypothetical protein